jgi:hypothetical protein
MQLVFSHLSTKAEQEVAPQEKVMNTMKMSFAPVKVGLVTGLVAIAGLSMLVGTAKPAVAGSSFSISISTNDFTLGYRNYNGGGYRYWHPGCYDSHHHWLDGYYSGPVVYNVGPGYDSDRHFDGGYSQPDYRSDDHSNYRGNDHSNYRDDHNSYRTQDHDGDRTDRDSHANDQGGDRRDGGGDHGGYQGH